MLAVGVLGPVTVRRDDAEIGLRGTRQRALLAALTLDVGQVVSTDRLVERVWGDDQPVRPENALQQQVLKLRRALGDDAVAFEAPGYRLALEPEAVDAVRFERLLERARREARDPGEAMALLDEALSLWRGPALVDFVYEPWAAGEAERLEELGLQAHEARADALLRLGRQADAIVELRPRVTREPPRERLWALLMLALYRDGRQAEALAVYADARQALVDVLGIEPGTELRGLHDRVLHQDPALERAPEPAGPLGSPATERSMPGPLARHRSAGPFVGREPELERLSAAWGRATSGRLGSVFVAGDPGAGKTRLVAEHAHAVAAEGGRVTYARADEDVSAPYGLFVSALTQLVETAPSDVMRTHVEAHGGELARLVPGLATRVPELPATRAADPETERFRLHEAVIAFITAVARREPMLVVLEDIHWADRASLVLLGQLLGGPEAPLLVVAIYRGTAVDQRPPLRTMLPGLLRGPDTEPLLVAGLTEADVVALTEAALGRAPNAGETLVGRRVHRETHGNALFATELLRSLASAGTLSAPPDPDSPLAIPATVREIVVQRLTQIGARAVEALLPATVIGTAFDTDALAHLTDLSEGELLDSLQHASDAALVLEGREPGSFSFTHAVIRAALADALGPSRRRMLQRRLAQALEAEDVGDARRLGQLARLWIESGDRERGRRTAIRAGDAALALLAPDEAAHWYRQALDLQEADAASDEAERGEILVRLGEAERRAGSESFRDLLLDAGRLARRLGDPDLLARAALANNRGMHSQTGIVDTERLELLEAALAVSGSGDDGQRALLLATTSSELWSDDHDRRLALSAEALEVARRAGDERVLAEVIYRRAFATAEPATLDERYELTAELIDLTDRVGDQLLRVLASVERSRAAIESAQLAEAVVHVDRQRVLAAQCGDAYGRHGAGWAQAWPHALAGRYSAAEQAAEQALAESLQSEQPDALAFYGAQIAAIRWDQGRLGELADGIVAHAQGPDGLPAHRGLAALALADSGRLTEAGRMIDVAAVDGFVVPVDTIWLTGMVMWGEACALCGRADAAPMVLEQLLPWREQVAFTGMAVHGCAARVAAELAGLLNRDDTDDLFACAERVHQRLAAPALLARTWAGWARWLSARGEQGRAATLQGQARESAEACGCPHLAEPAAVT